MSVASRRWTLVVAWVWAWAGIAAASTVTSLPPAGDACAARPTEDPSRPAASPRLHVGESRLRLRLAWRDLTGVMSPLADEVRREVAAVFAAVDVGVDWRAAGPQEPIGDEEISVVLLPQPRGQLPAGVMGAVNRRSGHQAWIFLSGIQGRLSGRSPAGALGPVDPHELARLTGRVVAHELVHVIAPGLGHTARGLMQAAWGRAFAVQPRVDLDDAAARAFLSALDPTTARCQPLPPTVATDSDAGDPVDLL
jgi:hypothetical protein